MAKPGTFQKGDGRRRGPPPLPVEIREAFRAASPKALETLQSVMRRFDEGDAAVPASAAVSAAVAVLDRAWGKPQSAPEDLEALTQATRPLRDVATDALARLAKMPHDDDE